MILIILGLLYLWGVNVGTALAFWAIFVGIVLLFTKW